MIVADEDLLLLYSSWSRVFLATIIDEEWQQKSCGQLSATTPMTGDGWHPSQKMDGTTSCPIRISSTME